MTRTYRCPHCNASLNPGENIVLLGAPEASEDTMLVAFHPEPGNYEVRLPPGVEIENGDRWAFRCPVCRERLRSAHDDALCEVMLEDDPPKQILFSRVAGEEVTFVIDTSRQIAERHGTHSGQYVHHLMQMKYIL